MIRHIVTTSLPEEEISRDIVFTTPEGWIVKFGADKGVEFNRERFPEWKPDDFAMKFIEIMEGGFNIHFESVVPGLNPKVLNLDQPNPPTNQ